VKVSKDGAETVLESGELMEIFLMDKIVALK
jgi:hypothetical protein